ncbi:6383_t:CDS:2 [Gigaspora rosea]|nr:6383_t:CDS:2 [Gigaspora rosea]
MSKHVTPAKEEPDLGHKYILVATDFMSHWPEARAVEKANAQIVAEKIKVKNVIDWDLLITSILFAYRTARNSTTKIILFFLMYGRETRQPIHPSHYGKNAAKTGESKGLPLPNICVSFVFEIGDKVILEDAKKRYSRSDKPAPKCTGPYYVHDKLSNDAYKLRTLGGKVILAPFNLSLLNRYHDREVAESEDKEAPTS